MVIGFLEKNIFRKFNLSSATNDFPASSKPSPQCVTVKPESGRSQNSGSDADQRATLPDPLLLSTREYQDTRDRKLERINGLFYPLVLIVLVSWIFGTFGVSWAWILFIIFGAWAFVKGVVDKIVEDFIRLESLRVHQTRALQSDESCEWLNLILNRWWVFSSGSIFSHVKTLLDPILSESKPNFLESINLKHLDFGDRTPCLKNVRSWDVQRNISHRSRCSLHTPSGLAVAPSHTLAFLCDVILDSEAFSAILETRIGHKGMGVDLDVGIEHLSVEGQVLITLFLDSEVPFPHVARMALSFTERPKVNFKVKVLKSVQMMEVPVLKTWIHNLVNESLATAWVDPGQLEVNINSNETFVPDHRSGDLFAIGVLSVVVRLKRNIGTGLGSEDDKWVVVSVGGKTHMSAPITSHLWQFSCSFLLMSPISTTNLVLKVKTKRLITSTITQYDLPLNQYNFEHAKVAETVLQKKGTKVIGSHVPSFHVRLEFTPLDPINLDSSVVDHPTGESEENGAGVLYIMVHGADNLIPTTGSSPSPYCLVFNSRKKVKTTHYVNDCSKPRWECGVEVLVSDVSSACVTFVVCSLSTNPKMRDGDLLGIHTLNLSTVTLPLIRKQVRLNRNIASPSSDDPSQPIKSSVIVSVIFRSVPSISGHIVPSTSTDDPHYRGMPLPMPSGNLAGNSCFYGNLGPNTGAIFPSHSLQSTSWKGSTGFLDDEEHKKKRWLHQAKHLLGAGTDNEIAIKQDLGDILASGLGLVELTIIKARDLVARDLNGFSDPYCVIKVNGEMKYRTKVRKKTLDPLWNESLMTHLPRKDQSLVITLWDHDAFGKDFLGSVSLEQEQVRSFSATNNPVWCYLDGVKSGSLQVRIKLISEDSQFENKGTSRSISEDNYSFITNNGDPKQLESQEDISVLLPQNEAFKLSLPNRTHLPLQDGSAFNLRNNLWRASSNPSLSSNSSKNPDGELKVNKYHPLYTPLRTRKSGAQILASALAQAKAESKESLIDKNEIISLSQTVSLSEKEPPCENDIKFDAEISAIELDKEFKDRLNKNTSSSSLSLACSTLSLNSKEKLEPMIKTCSNYEIESIHSLSLGRKNYNRGDKKSTNSLETNRVPKISLNDHSEDDFGFNDYLESSNDTKNFRSAIDSQQKKKKGLRAVKEKFRRFRRK